MLPLNLVSLDDDTIHQRLLGLLFCRPTSLLSTAQYCFGLTVLSFASRSFLFLHCTSWVRCLTNFCSFFSSCCAFFRSSPRVPILFLPCSLFTSCRSHPLGLTG